MVAGPQQASDLQANSTAAVEQFISAPNGKAAQPPNVEKHRLQDLWEALTDRGASAELIKTLQDNWAKETKTYSQAWESWTDFCSGRQADIFRPSELDVCEWSDQIRQEHALSKVQLSKWLVAISMPIKCVSGINVHGSTLLDMVKRAATRKPAASKRKAVVFDMSILYDNIFSTFNGFKIPSKKLRDRAIILHSTDQIGRPQDAFQLYLRN